jgi:hypothetical protein
METLSYAVLPMHPLFSGRASTTELIRRLVSTKNTIDQALGMYSFEMFGHNGYSSMVSTFNSSRTYWSSGDWDGRHFSNVPETLGRQTLLEKTAYL